MCSPSIKTQNLTREPNSDNQNALQDLDAEMKLLRWHKLANESALQAALLRTRQAGRNDKMKRPATERAARRHKSDRMRRVVEEEHAKPLQVSNRW